MAPTRYAGAPQGERRESLGTESRESAESGESAASTRPSPVSAFIASRADAAAIVPARTAVVLSRALILVALLVVVLLGVITAGCGPPN